MISFFFYKKDTINLKEKIKNKTHYIYWNNRFLNK